MKNNIKKLDLNMFPEDIVNEANYAKEMYKFIYSYLDLEATPITNDPQNGKIKWEEMYPNGYTDWAGHKWKINSYGVQMIIDKINEIIDKINKLESTKLTKG